MNRKRVLNPRGKWKEVTIDPQLYLTSGMEHFLSFEELTDYDLIDDKALNRLDSGVQVKTKKKKKKKSLNAVGKIGVTECEDDQSDSVESNKKIKKSKEKIKKSEKIKKNKTVKEKLKTDKVVQAKEKVKKDVKLKGKQGKLVRANKVEDITSEHPDISTERMTPSSKESLKKRKRKSKADDNGPVKKKTKPDNEAESVEGKTNTKTTTHSKSISDMKAWRDLYVPEPVMQALADQGFTEPMPIQTLALPSACRDKKDIIGAAETGSGKTLAFGIPLLYHILKDKDSEVKKRNAIQQQSEEDNFDDEHSYKDVSEADEDESDDDEDESEGDESEGDDDEDESEGDESEGDEDMGTGEDLPPSDEDGSEEEHDLPPSDEEELPELGTDDVGCVKVLNDVTFDWLEDEAVTKSEEGKTWNSSKVEEKPLYALVLTPTRELAIQVCNHINSAAKYTGIKATVVVGGMAPQKQRRVLKKCPEIVVATPGRLWELIQEDAPHLLKVPDVRYLVIDEADRMVEKGHFAELQMLLELINRNEEKKKKRQTFIFSATLTMVHTGPYRTLKKKKKENMTVDKKLEKLVESIGIKEKPKVIDLTSKIGMAEKVIESRIHCSIEEKDLYLYYLLQQYPGRTLVFCNSKDSVRRLVSIFTLLKCNPLPLHADMHQRQRLKNLDKFRDNGRSLLLATDVAARGLDIPGVEHVVHFQVPRTSENYIHRSGRTARAYSEGLSVILISPKELKSYRKILHTMKREENLPIFPVEEQFILRLKERVSLARSIDTQEHRFNKKKVQNSWFEKAAKEMDIELDKDLLCDDVGDSKVQADHKYQIAGMKYELNALLSQPVVQRFFSGKYPTMSGKLKVPYMKDFGVGGAVTKVREVQNQKSSFRKEVKEVAANPRKKNKRKFRKSKS